MNQEKQPSIEIDDKLVYAIAKEADEMARAKESLDLEEAVVIICRTAKDLSRSARRRLVYLVFSHYLQEEAHTWAYSNEDWTAKRRGEFSEWLNTRLAAIEKFLTIALRKTGNRLDIDDLIPVEAIQADAEEARMLAFDIGATDLASESLRWRFDGDDDLVQQENFVRWLRIIPLRIEAALHERFSKRIAFFAQKMTQDK